MRLLRRRIGKSLGLYAFRTKPSDLLEKAGEYRQYAERGRYDLIERQMNTDATMVAMSGGFDEAWYMKWAPAVYSNNNHIRKAVWSPDYWMIKETSYFKGATQRKLFDVWDKIERDRQEHKYIPIRWTTGGVSQDDVASFPMVVLARAERLSVPLYYFAMRIVGDRWTSRMVLYAKVDFLDTFKSGQDMINYYRMAMNFKKVYGFS